MKFLVSKYETFRLFERSWRFIWSTYWSRFLLRTGMLFHKRRVSISGPFCGILEMDK